jgi:hypothetical protein
MGRLILLAAALLLLATAIIHAGGQPMVDRWVHDLSDQQRAAICLVWITDSINWAIVSVIWSVAAWRRERGWLGAAAVAALIPLTVGIGVLAIEPRFFGGWMLMGSVALAGVGLGLLWRGRSAE